MQLASGARSMLLSPSLRGVRFSRTELRHLALGTVLVTAAGVSFILGNAFTLPGLILAALIF
jgi:hypothetical protein